jgi:oligopeptide/dipeptide ABC transporter ATP-binding protein
MNAGLTLEAVTAAVGGQEVLTDVDLSVQPGECVGVVGETGSGKTLTCRVVLGTLPRIGGSITGGSARFGELDLLALSGREWRATRGRRIALVPQASMSALDPVMTVGRQLTETIDQLRGSERSEPVALELLERVQMPRPAEILRSHPHQLSGGMRQRVMIALAIAGNPELLIADEPTTALDVTVQRDILALLTSLRRETGMSMVFVSHDLGVVQEVADRVVVMYGGTTVEHGDTSTVLQRPSHPYTRALLAARPSAAGARGRLAEIPGVPPSPHDWPQGCRFHPRCGECRPQCVSVRPPSRRVGSGSAVACARAEELA